MQPAFACYMTAPETDTARAFAVFVLTLDRATVVALVDTLESSGLARRIRSREDRRANAVELTAKGRRVLKQADALMEACESKFVSTLPPAEQTQLRVILERLLAADRQAQDTAG